MNLTSDFKSSSQKVIESLKEDLKSVRTGHASPSLVENLVVDAYSGTTKLRLLELATITTEGPSALSIIPFDSSTIQDIERSILKSPLGLSPLVQGARIIIKIPPLSSEQREKFVKIIGEKVEEKKVHIRNNRDSVRRILKGMFEKKEITEDDIFRLEKEVDTITQKFMEEIQLIRERKEKEIREV